jgi:hypothetical protein
VVTHIVEVERILPRDVVGHASSPFCVTVPERLSGAGLRLCADRDSCHRHGSKSMAAGVDIQPGPCVVFSMYRERQRQAGAGDDGTTREVRQDGQAGRSLSRDRFRLVAGAAPRDRAVKTQ